MKKHLRIVQGGSSAGKTIAILLILIHLAQTSKNKTISIVSESYPHLRRGAIKDFLNILQENGYYKDDLWNKTESTYTFETGTRMEFFSADQPGKVRGPRRDILFLNEANNLSYETYTQLAIRTNEYIYIDYNPVSEFWVQEEIIPNQEHDFEILTYKDNETLSDVIVKEIESRMHNKNFWRVFGLGLLGEIEGKIYKDWRIIDEVPHEARLISYGLDFGYTNDPTSIVAIYYLNGGYILDEVCFTKGLSNKQIADIILASKPAPVIADSAEPKSIDEMRLYGITIMPATKGKGSVAQGIQFVQAQQISVTKQSVNVIKEYRNYIWETDREGKVMNEPEHLFSHSMDAVRYGLQIKNVETKTDDYVTPVPWQPAGYGKSNIPPPQQSGPVARQMLNGRVHLGDNPTEEYVSREPWQPPGMSPWHTPQ
ncbi:unnamed protein product [Sphagnum balticum]